MEGTQWRELNVAAEHNRGLVALQDHHPEWSYDPTPTAFTTIASTLPPNGALPSGPGLGAPWGGGAPGVGGGRGGRRGSHYSGKNVNVTEL
eukprot:COSAG01_NODE_49594_length_371_cov_0.444853_1_plen_90_part_10